MLVIVCEGLMGSTHGDSDDPTGLMLKSYDPDAMDGRGKSDWTGDPAQAMKFTEHIAAWTLWRQQSVTRPTRPDGKPNRPLTAYSISVQPLPDGH